MFRAEAQPESSAGGDGSCLLSNKRMKLTPESICRRVRMETKAGLYAVQSHALALLPRLRQVRPPRALCSFPASSPSSPRNPLPAAVSLPPPCLTEGERKGGHSALWPLETPAGELGLAREVAPGGETAARSLF